MKHESIERQRNGKTMAIQVELSRILICELNQHQVVFLREKDGPREFPIIIGLFEATIIDRKIKRLPSPRPYTHDLLCQIVKSMGGQFRKVEITRMEKQTFYAQIHIEMGNTLLSLDARPSDALAIAVTHTPHLAIYVSEDVFNQALSLELP